MTAEELELAQEILDRIYARMGIGFEGPTPSLNERLSYLECALELKEPVEISPRMQGQSFQEGLEVLSIWSRNIAMLPLEGWTEALEHAETICPILDPTLYRQYLYDVRSIIVPRLLRAALELKRIVMDAQPAIREEMEGGR